VTTPRPRFFSSDAARHGHLVFQHPPEPIDLVRGWRTGVRVNVGIVSVYDVFYLADRFGSDMFDALDMLSGEQQC